jgi:hypothetical protein
MEVRELAIEELLELISNGGKLDADSIEDQDDAIDAENSAASGKWGVYCNCLTIDSGTGGYVYYRRGDRGTPNYGCGTDRYRAPKSLARYIKQAGSCSKTACNKKTKYLVTNYPT